MHVYPNRFLGFPQRNHPLVDFITQTYRAFSSLDPQMLNREHILASTIYKTKDGRAFPLTIKINRIGYLITQLGNENDELLQEMIVKASPEFQLDRADKELRIRIKNAILDSIKCVTDGLTPSYEMLRRSLALSFAGDEKVTLINGFDDERLVRARVLDIATIPEFIELGGKVSALVGQQYDKKPLIVALGAMKVFIFSL